MIKCASGRLLELTGACCGFSGEILTGGLLWIKKEVGEVIEQNTVLFLYVHLTLSLEL